jgi:hypothetical protein
MPSQNAAELVIDHTHCRAICDEIGDRLRDILKPEASEVPPRLLELIDKLAELERAPSIVPSIEDTSFPGPAIRVKRSADPVLAATNRLSDSVEFLVEHQDRRMAASSRELRPQSSR